ncbi:MAG: hypothetical protein HF962_04945 [Sulfurovum sp.]|nr:hypothetical protein [Sulfurovum sp.]
MPLEIFHTDEYKSIIKDHLFNTMAFLLENGVEFSIAAEIRHIGFSPELPSDIISGFGDVVLFVMAGYTFESAHIDDDHFFFEAGFGADGFGSHVTVPILSIKQVSVDDYPLAINISEPAREKAKKTTVNKSMEALLNNPENKKLLKKAKK